MKKTMTLTPGAVIEPVGDDAMVMMPGNTDVLRITGPAAETLRNIVAGQPVDASTPAVLELADHGIISAAGMSRRGLIRAGAIGAGASIAVLAMPSVAAAASGGGGGGGGGSTILGTWSFLPYWPAGTTENIPQSSSIMFLISNFIFPSGLGSGTFVFGQGDSDTPFDGGPTPPGPLAGLPSQFNFQPLIKMAIEPFDASVQDRQETNADGVRRYGSNFVQWRLEHTGTPSGPLSASFVWDGVTYQVTFQPLA